jgi:hypothetical protein
MSGVWIIRSVHAALLDGPLRFAAGEVLAVHRRAVTARVQVAGGAGGRAAGGVGGAAAGVGGVAVGAGGAAVGAGGAALVTFARPELGDGPLGVLVSGAWPAEGLAAGDAVVPTIGGWRVGHADLRLMDAQPWTPPRAPVARPAAWPGVRQALAAALAALPGPGGAAAALGLTRSGDAAAGADSGDAPGGTGGPGAGFAAAAARLLGERARALQAVLQGAGASAGTSGGARDSAGAGAQVAAAARGLVGLGGGLTPAGDDLLAGLLTFLLRAGQPLAQQLLPVARGAQGKTTPVAAHMLAWAADGVVNAHLLAVADAAVAGDTQALLAALPEALDHGATSGADFATGVWLGLGLA